VSARKCGAPMQVFSTGQLPHRSLCNCSTAQGCSGGVRARARTSAPTHLTVFLACAAAFFASLRCLTFCSPRMAPHDDELSAAQLSLTGDAPGQTWPVFETVGWRGHLLTDGTLAPPHPAQQQLAIPVWAEHVSRAMACPACSRSAYGQRAVPAQSLCKTGCAHRRSDE